MAIFTCLNCGAKNRVDEAEVAIRRPVCGRCRTPLSVPVNVPADGRPAERSDATFDGFLRQAGDKPILVDAWAAWCGPCRMLALTIDALAAESRDEYLVAKLDTDRNPATTARFRIEALPTVLIFRRGQLVDQLVGLQPKQAIATKLKQHSA